MQNSTNISCHNTRASSAPEEHPLHNQEQRPSLVSSLGISETSNGTLLDDKWVSLAPFLLYRSFIFISSSTPYPQQERNSDCGGTEDTDDGMENGQVEYAVLLPDSFAVLDSSY